MISRAKRYWNKIRQRIRGVADEFSSPTATPVVLNPLANDQGGSLHITHIANRPIAHGIPLNFGNYTVTVALGDVVTVAAVGGYIGPVSFYYRFTDGRTSGVAQIVGGFV